jgi:hypothetical protein
MHGCSFSLIAVIESEEIVMLVVFAVLLLLAALAFLGATVTLRRTFPAALVPLGLLLWVLVPLIQTFQAALK